jgi:hypothetical protein
MDGRRSDGGRVNGRAGILASLLTGLTYYLIALYYTVVNPAGRTSNKIAHVAL